MNNILYIEQSGYGNVISSIPVLKAMRKYFPSHCVILNTWNRTKNLSKAICKTEIVDDVSFEHPVITLQSNRGADYVFISPVGSLTHPYMAKYAKKIISNPVKAPWTKHEVEYKMDMIRGLGFTGNTPSIDLEIKESDKWKEIKDKNRLQDFIIINASYLKSDHWYLKHWGNNKYIELCKYLSKYDCRLVFVGDVDDIKDANEIIEKSQVDAVNLCGFSTNIMDTASCLKDALLVIGNDSGIAHISSAVGTPNLTIFTFTNTIKNKPYSDVSFAITKDDHCENRIYCQHGKYNTCKCIDVPTEKVINIVEQVLQ